MGLRKQCCPVSNRLPRYSNAYSEAAENVTGGGCGRFERVKPLCFDLAGFAAPILKIPRIGKTSKKLPLFQFFPPISRNFLNLSISTHRDTYVINSTNGCSSVSDHRLG